MDKKPLILIVNDDGIFSPGIKAAAEAIEDLADLLIAAPHVQQTGMGRAFVRSPETGIVDLTEIELNGRWVQAYGVHGTPAFSVAHAVLELADRKPALCISGINYGENLGTTLTCSGTLGAAFEAVTYGIPALAVSLEADLKVQRLNEFCEMDFTYSKKVLRLWCRKILEQGMGEGVDIWNINVPSGSKEAQDYRITSQSRQNYFEFIRPQQRKLEEPFALQTEISVDRNTLEKNSDIYAVHVDRIASVTPLNMQLSAACRKYFSNEV